MEVRKTIVVGADAFDPGDPVPVASRFVARRFATSVGANRTKDSVFLASFSV
jgi:hypothetical protein